MKLLITGGTGFFGKALLRQLIARQEAATGDNWPEQVVVVSRAPERFLALHPEFSDLPWLRFHPGDIGVPTSLPYDRDFDCILHAAADSTDVNQLTQLQRFDQIVNGTRNMLDFAVSCNAEKFLLTSSGAVYGIQPPHLEQVPESWHGVPDPLLPSSAYGMGKRVAENLCALYGQAFGLRTIVARCFAFVGPDLPLDAHFAIGNFIRDALWRDQITVAGDGKPLRSYLDQKDLAHWLLHMLFHAQSGQAYNVGSDQAISISELAHLVRDIVAPHKPVRILGASDSGASRNVYVPSIERARRELGLKVTIPLKNAIQAVADSIRGSGRGSTVHG